MGARALEKQTILYGAHCIENAHCKKQADADEHHWGPEDLEDERFNRELDNFMSEINPPGGVTRTKEKEKPQGCTTVLFDADYCVTKEFYAYIET